MKEKIPFIIGFTAGIALLVTGSLIKNHYDSALLCSTGFGIAFAHMLQIVRMIYWKNPKRQTAYEEKVKAAHINSIDERRQYIRMKAGCIAYQAMTFVLLILTFVLSLVRADVWVIGMVYLLFLLNSVIGIAAIRILEKKY